MNLSYSRTATLAACPRKYENRYEKGWEVSEVNVPMHGGKVMAVGLHALHTEHKAKWQRGDDGEVHEACCEVLERDWGDFITPPGHKHAYLTLGHLETVLWYYIRDRDPWQIEPLVSDGKIIAEEKIKFDWPRIKNGKVELINVTGIPDIPALIAGQRAVVDWKCTTGYVTDWWAKKFSVIGHQLKTYMALLRHAYGIEVECAYVDGVYMGKMASQDDEKWKKRTSARSRLFGPYNFTASQLAETWEWYKIKQKEIEFYRAEGYFPQDESSCPNYGGCDFIPLCNTAPGARDARKESSYRIKNERT